MFAFIAVASLFLSTSFITSVPAPQSNYYGNNNSGYGDYGNNMMVIPVMVTITMAIMAATVTTTMVAILAMVTITTATMVATVTTTVVIPVMKVLVT